MECRLRVFENKVLRRIFGPKRDVVTVEWRRLHNKELYAVYSSPNIIRVIKSRGLRWAGHVARMGERKGTYRTLVWKHEGRRPLGRPRRRWEDNIKVSRVGLGASVAKCPSAGQQTQRPVLVHVLKQMCCKKPCKCPRSLADYVMQSHGSLTDRM
jgi:hypothetical protein